MRAVSIGEMIRALVDLGKSNDMAFTRVHQSFIRSADDRSRHGADTSVLSDKDVEIIDSIFREYFV